MLKHLFYSAIIGFIALPIAAAAQSAGPTINAAALPDTTVQVTMQNGAHTTLTAGRPAMTFTSVHPGDTLMLSTSKGTVLVFKDYGVVPAATATP